MTIFLVYLSVLIGTSLLGAIYHARRGSAGIEDVVPTVLLAIIPILNISVLVTLAYLVGADTWIRRKGPRVLLRN